MLLVLAMLVTNCPITAFASTTAMALEGVNLETYEYEDFQYTVLSDGTLSICGDIGTPVDEKEGTYLEVPAAINDLVVTQIAEGAFENNDHIDAIAIPETITTVGESAFAHCEDLKAIAFWGDLPEFGATIVDGCNSLNQLYVLAGYDTDALDFQLSDADIANVTILVYEDLDALRNAYNEYIVSLDADIQAMELPDKITGETTPETTAPSALSEETEATADVNETTDNVTSGTIGEPTEGTEETTESTEYSVVTEPTVEVTKAVNQEASNVAVTSSTDTDFLYVILNGTYCEITGYIGTDTELTVPSEIDGYIVQRISDSAFEGNTALTAITFPSSIETIGTYVFSGCTALSDVRLNFGLTNISGYAFNGCNSLVELDLPSTITKIHAYAFQDCTSLVSIDIPDSVTTISSRAFYKCTKLSEVNYPAGWTTLLSYWDDNRGDGDSYNRSPFEGCTALTKIEIPEGVTTIPKHAFRYVTALEEVILPESLTTIGAYAFDGCTGLRAIELNTGLETIDSYAFQGCTALTTVNMPDTLVTISSYAYSGCTGLSSVTLNSGLTSLGTYVFQKCSGLKHITIPETITTINGYVFSGCTGLSEVVLPTTLTAIRAYAFQDCTSLVSTDIPDSVTTISSRAFYKCTKLSEMGYPAGWTTLLSNWDDNRGDGDSYNHSPFEGCTALTKIEIPEGVTTIPKHAFRYVTALEEVILPESLTTIGVYTFDGCTKLKTINLVDGITEISAYCFNNCTGINYLTLPDTLETVGDHAFYNCKGLRSVSMGPGLKTICRYAFYGCQGLVSLFMGGNIETISEYAFAECINIKSITLPTELLKIGNAAFANCAKISDLNVPNSVFSIADNTFSGLTDLIFYCSMNSYAAIYAIDHNIPIIDTEDSTDNSLYIDRETSYYRVNGDGISASGYLTMVAKYDFLDSISATDIKLTFNIPSAVELDESTLTVDGVLCTDYTFENSVLIVRVSNTSGTVRFLLKPLNYDRVTAYCKVSFNNGKSNHTEVVGTIYTEIPILSITSPAQTSNTSVKVTGVTIPNSNVTLYVNGSEYTTVKANKVGDYSATIQFTSPSNGKKYTIRAKVIDSTGATVTAETATTYRVSVPVLTQFIMEYGGKIYNLHELVGTKPNITWASSYQYKFTVSFKNVEGVSSVFVVSTRNNVNKYMQAQWDETAQAFIAEGYFDSNSSYVPGIISVEYVRSNGSVSFADGYDFTSDEAYNNLPQNWQVAEVIVNEDTDNKCDIIVDYPENTSDGEDYALHYVTETYTRTDGYSENDAIADGYTKITDDFGKSIYVRQSMDSNTITLSTLEFSGLNGVIKVSDITIDLLTSVLNDAGDKIFEKPGNTIDILGWIDTTIGTIDDIAEIDRIQQEIRNSKMSSEEKARALAQTYMTQTVNIASFFMKGALFAAGTLTLSGPWGLVAGAALILTGELVDVWDDYFMQRLLAMSFTWAIDPSGFVYNNETGMPILEATVTAYWIPYDENDSEYWNEKPADDEYGELWDSSGFGQENPLTTDISGWYAWDVPEGWWRVKSERFGYEPAWSDWVPVPPPQMDVHIGMTPLDNCGYCGKNVIWIIDDAGTLTISGNGDMADYSADESAPWHDIASTVTNVVIEEGVISIGSYAFDGCTNLTSIKIAATIESIGTYAFHGCATLQEMTIGENISDIVDYAFSRCTSLSKVTFEGDVPTIGTGVFQEVTATAYYPTRNESWTSDVMQNYGGTIEWIAYAEDACVHTWDNDCDADCNNCGESREITHKYSAVVTPPTATEQGYTTHTCSSCGDSYVDSYVDPIPQLPEAEIGFSRMILGNELAMQYAFKQADIDPDTEYVVSITKTYADGREDKVIQVPESQWKTATVSGEPYYYVSFNGIAAKEMNDAIHVQVVTVDGASAGEEFITSVSKYALDQLRKTTVAATRTLYVDMLNYGAAAQTYFKYNANDLANADLTATEKGYATKSVNLENRLVKGTGYSASQLNLASSIQLRVRFSNIDSSMYAVIRFTNHMGRQIESRVEGSEFMYSGTVVVIDDVVAADFDRDVSVKVYDANGKEIANAVESVASYLARQTDKADAPAIYDAVAKYCASAYAYLHK